MARPALSASRATAVLDLLSAHPNRAFTMAEIVRETDINIASCHALLTALASRGYLTRAEDDRGYTLGPALVTVGQAALKTNSLIGRAQGAAESLARDLGVGVLLSTIAGEEILALTACAGRNGRSPGMRPGQRFPFIAPAGAHFVAWSPQAVDAWIARAGHSSKREIGEWRDAVRLIRARGFQVTLRVPVNAEFGPLISEMATGIPGMEFAQKAAQLIKSHGWHLDQLEKIEPDTEYGVALIASPIFDRRGTAALSLGLGGFSEKLLGSRIKSYASELMRTCVEVMQEDRSE